MVGDFTVIILIHLSIAASTRHDICSDGNIRLGQLVDDLLNGTRQGRIEICFNNAWGTVCDTSFGNTDAHVACKQLTGFQPEGTVALPMDYIRSLVNVTFHWESSLTH